MKKAFLWILALIITLGTLAYQRLTGPTYPLRGKTQFDDTTISYRLARSQVTTSDYELRIKVSNPEIKGYILYKRFKTSDEWTSQPLRREGDVLAALLPHQPPAGKLAYQVFLSSGDKETSLSGGEPVVIRFRGEVPDPVIILHVIVMFLAMLLSTRAGLEALRPTGNPRKLALWATIMLFVGGMILGALVQKFAFGAFWTGFPLGRDLTDNKTLFALVGWIIALIAGRRGKPARGWVLAASILTLAVFLIPHSLLGSELDYSKVEAASEQLTFSLLSSIFLSHHETQCFPACSKSKDFKSIFSLSKPAKRIAPCNQRQDLQFRHRMAV